jgi:Tfp pilus assembly protein FimV
VRKLAINTLACTAAATFLTPAQAVTLGEIAVDSSLGQPLTARVPVTLAPGEMLTNECLSSVPVGSSDLIGVPEPRFRLEGAASSGAVELRVSTARSLYEPMYELQLQVRCPGTALVVRQYVLMLDLPGAVTRPVTAAPPAPAAQPAAARSESAAVASPPAVRPARAKVQPGEPIVAGVRYRVQAGDTLSTIAARVNGRSGMGIWQLADRIFTANPAAFIGNNPDLIKLGAEIVIPAASAVVPGSAAEQPEVPPAAQPPAVPVSVATAVEAPLLPSADAVPPPVELPVESAVATVPEPVATPVAADPPAAVVRVTAVDDEPDSAAPPWLAALLGVLIGAAASLALLRERLVSALRRTPATSTTVAASAGTAAAVPAAAPVPQPIRTFPAREPSMVVVEEPAAQPAAKYPEPVPSKAREEMSPQPQSDHDTRDDLASLFGVEPDINLFEGENSGLTGQSATPDLDLDLDLSAAAVGTEVDEDIGWLDNNDETALTPTDRAERLRGSGGDTVEQQMDLNTMSNKAIEDAELSATLKEALDLLESDYEDELTASRVIDRSKLPGFSNQDDEEDTLIRTGTDQIPRR